MENVSKKPTAGEIKSIERNEHRTVYYCLIGIISLFPGIHITLGTKKRKPTTTVSYIQITDMYITVNESKNATRAQILEIIDTCDKIKNTIKQNLNEEGELIRVIRLLIGLVYALGPNEVDRNGKQRINYIKVFGKKINRQDVIEIGKNIYTNFIYFKYDKDKTNNKFEIDPISKACLLNKEFHINETIDKK